MAQGNEIKKYKVQNIPIASTEAPKETVPLKLNPFASSFNPSAAPFNPMAAAVAPKPTPVVVKTDKTTEKLKALK